MNDKKSKIGLLTKNSYYTILFVDNNNFIKKAVSMGNLIRRVKDLEIECKLESKS
jgi:hypothetical protein